MIGKCGCGDARLPMTGQAVMKLSNNGTKSVRPCGEDDGQFSLSTFYVSAIYDLDLTNHSRFF